MKVSKLIAAVLISVGPAVQAEPAVFAGITYLFDGPERATLGFTVKALASNHTDRPSASIGLSVYPSLPSPFGFDVGVGYQGTDAAGLVSYDLLLNRFSLSAGYADLKSD
jgi:hypothetical protein